MIAALIDKTFFSLERESTINALETDYCIKAYQRPDGLEKMFWHQCTMSKNYLQSTHIIESKVTILKHRLERS